MLNSPPGHYCLADARMRASANEQKAVKKFQTTIEKCSTKLKYRQKSGYFTKIKRQADQGLEGILREGRGLRPIAFPYQKK